MSLATLQSIEANRANPALSTWQAILAVVGLVPDVRPVLPDWSVLSVLGAPLALEEPHPSPVHRSPELLVHQLRLALAQTESLSPRQHEAVWAVLLSLHDHYPRFFRRHFGRSSASDALLRHPPTGRIVKLRRLALAVLSEYL